MRKLIIQIPCYNEEGAIGVTLNCMPRQVPGFEIVEWLIIDDGSEDQTVKEAKEHGADHIVRHNSNKGLAEAFMTGLQACLEHGAHVVVNTDADNQYNANDICKLVAPILEGKADMVIGVRPISAIKHFSYTKRMLQKLGSWVVRIMSKTDVPDAPSGFRAISKEAAQKLMVFNDYTYTLETIIQAGHRNLALKYVPVRVNEDLRPSRLVRSIPSYIIRSIFTMIRVFVIYKPFRFFGAIGLLLFSIGLLLGIRFLIFIALGEGAGHVQSLILAAILLGMGFQTILTAFLADLHAANRRLLEDVRYLLKRGINHRGK
jgi:glycosyltransferase involved in cell wall biosynthesis